MRIKLKYLVFALLLIGIYGIFSTDITVTPTIPVNYTNYSVNGIALTITLSPASNTTYCNFTAGYGNGTTSVAAVMANTTATNTSFTNASAFTPILDNTLGTWHNLTFTCQNKTAGQTFTSVVLYGYDTTSPVISSITETLSNATTGGNRINVTFSSTDTNAKNYNCSVKISDRTNVMVNTVYGRWNDTSTARLCDALIYPGNFSKDGNYTLTPWANDSVNNVGFGTNQTYTAYNLKTGWNLIEIPENLTLVQVASLSKNITTVSVLSNLLKTYTTFVVGAATNSNVRINSTNGTYVYANQDVTVLREHVYDKFGDNVSLYNIASNGWNNLGIINRHTLNETMYLREEGGMATWIYNLAGTNATSSNSTQIVSASWYNATLGKQCTAIRGFSYTSCSPQFNATDIVVERGQAVWIQVSANMTLERGAT